MIVPPGAPTPPIGGATRPDSLLRLLPAPPDWTPPSQNIPCGFAGFSGTGWVNGGPGALITTDGRPFLVLSFDIDPHGRLRQIDAVLNPDKLRAV